MATKVKGGAIKEGSIPLSALSSEIINKLSNDKYKKLDWYYDADVDACMAESQTNKIIINEKEYNLTDEAVGISVNGRVFGFQYTNRFGEYSVIAQGSDGEEFLDMLINNVFILNESASVATPDWNAQKGEAGYIENKPFRIIKSKNSKITNINSYFIITEGAFYPTNDLFIKYNNKTVLLAKRKQEIYWGDGTTVQIDDAIFFLADDGKSNIIVAGECEFNFELIIALSSEFIPDTVLKTTPQSFSDTDKNQALTNLGIDPVVWKYICNPCIIKQGKKVPEELIGEYAEDVGYDGGYYLKYPNLAMYKIMITNNSIDIEFDGPASVIITPSDISEYGLSIQDIYISKDYGVYVGGANIDEDKKWEIK